MAWPHQSARPQPRACPPTLQAVGWRREIARCVSVCCKHYAFWGQDGHYWQRPQTLRHQQSLARTCLAQAGPRRRCHCVHGTSPAAMLWRALLLVGCCSLSSSSPMADMSRDWASSSSVLRACSGRLRLVASADRQAHTRQHAQHNTASTSSCIPLLLELSWCWAAGQVYRQNTCNTHQPGEAPMQTDRDTTSHACCSCEAGDPPSSAQT